MLYTVRREPLPDPDSYMLTLDRWRGALQDRATMTMGSLDISAPAKWSGNLNLKGEHVAVIGDGLGLFYFG